MAEITEIENKIQAALSKIRRVDEVVDRDVDIRKGGYVDSLDFIEFLFHVEKIFDLKIDDEKIEALELHSIAKLSDFISKNINQ